jgi:predicted SAM-dependent methyltransferase
MLGVRQLVRSLIPKELRLFRYTLYEYIKYYPDLFVRLGRGLECPFCGWQFRRFKPAGFHYPVIIEKKVIGGHWHEDNVCPRCLSNARERLAFIFFREQTDIFERPLGILHIAPEPKLSQKLKDSHPAKYITTDLFERKVMVTSDLLSLPFADSSFDVVICNHVLEHVDDDRRAMFEIHRVLNNGGWAMLQVPLALALDRSIEDPSVRTDEDRIRLFGQADHVRLYSRSDYLARLEAQGFAVEAYSCGKQIGAQRVQRHGLVAEEEIFIARRLNLAKP